MDRPREETVINPFHYYVIYTCFINNLPVCTINIVHVSLHIPPPPISFFIHYVYARDPTYMYFNTVYVYFNRNNLLKRKITLNAHDLLLISCIISARQGGGRYKCFQAMVPPLIEVHE